MGWSKERDGERGRALSLEASLEFTGGRGCSTKVASRAPGDRRVDLELRSNLQCKVTILRRHFTSHLPPCLIDQNARPATHSTRVESQSRAHIKAPEPVSCECHPRYHGLHTSLARGSNRLHLLWTACGYKDRLILKKRLFWGHH